MALTQQAAVEAFAAADLLRLGMEADALRRTLHPQNTVTYTLDESTDAGAAGNGAGDASFAGLVIGRGESVEERILQIAAIRRRQEERGGLVAFELAVHHFASPVARREEEASAVDYLKTLAICRLMLDNIPHIQASWTVQGPKVLELALCFGADDAGSIAAAPARGREPSHHGGESELRRIIRDAGFRPVRRDPLYRYCFLE